MDTGDGSVSSSVAVVIFSTVGGAFILLLVAVVIGVVCYRRRKAKHSETQLPSLSLSGLTPRRGGANSAGNAGVIVGGNISGGTEPSDIIIPLRTSDSAYCPHYEKKRLDDSQRCWENVQWIYEEKGGEGVGRRSSHYSRNHKANSVFQRTTFHQPTSNKFRCRSDISLTLRVELTDQQLGVNVILVGFFLAFASESHEQWCNQGANQRPRSARSQSAND
ncbi:Ephrin-B1 [Bagarius yarrelli]|uniref:Ephrin-B1 n=1 Tax=Bagarius yarrelli TaxID=175774 RepID=A0A556V526_BAGYA|nr:Ephrin-B1 [Bagarius yarrelli]